MTVRNVASHIEAFIARWPEVPRAAARHYEGLGTVVGDDLVTLRRMPFARILPYFVLTVTVLFSALHIGVEHVYTSSYPFLAAALLVGLLSPALGVLLVVVHSLFDLATYPSLSLAWPARLIADWLLWLLVVEIPLVLRAAEPDVSRIASGFGRPVSLVIMAALGAALVIVWALGIPLLIRPLFSWGPLNAPTDPVLDIVQRSHTLLALTAAVATLAGIRAREAWQGAAPAAPADSSPASVPGPARPLIRSALLIVAFGGMISKVWDVMILAGAIAVAPAATRAIARRPAIRELLHRTPRVVRFLGAFAVTYVLAQLVTMLTFRSVRVSEYFPLVLAAGIGLVVFRVILDADDVSVAPDGPAASSPGPVTRTLMIAAFVMLVPRALLANNCGSRDDCFGTAVAAGAAAAGVAAAGGFGSGRGRPPR
jgi:hypothetical protein